VEAKKAKSAKKAKTILFLRFLHFLPFLLPLCITSKKAHFVKVPRSARSRKKYDHNWHLKPPDIYDNRKGNLAPHSARRSIAQSEIINFVP
jgi:hypothetical protein